VKHVDGAEVTAAGRLNGYDVEELQEFVSTGRRDHQKAERNPVVTARWVGGSRARVEGAGFSPLHIGGDEEPSAMKALLGCLAACDVELVTMHATLLGIQIEELTVESRGHFTVRRLLGEDDAPPAGFDQVSYTIRLKAPGATPKQVDRLRGLCERASPVGDTLIRSVPLALEFIAE